MLIFYLIISVLALLLIAQQRTIFTFAYLSLIVLFFASLIYLPFIHPLPLSSLLLLLLLIVLRLMMVVIKEILQIQSMLGRQGSVRAFNKTTILWLPFPILALIGYSLLQFRNQSIAEGLEEFIYGVEVSERSIEYGCGPNFYLLCRCEQSANFSKDELDATESIFLPAHDCPSIDKSFYRINDSSGPIEKDIHTAVERLKQTFRQDIVRRLNQTLEENSETLKEQGGDLESVIFGSKQNRRYPIINYKLADYHPDLKPPSCNGIIDQLFKLKDCVKNIMLEPLSQAYADIREDLRVELKQSLEGGEEKMDNNIELLIDKVEEIVDKRLNDYSLQAHQSVEASFTTFKTLQQLTFILWLCLVGYALFVGFFYLYTRYVYNQNFGNIPFQFNAYESVIKDKEPISVSDITLDKTMNSFEQKLNGKTWFAKMDSHLRYEVDGIVSIPKPFSLILKRLPNHYLFFRYSEKDAKTSINAHADDLTRFIKVNLVKDQNIAFQFSSLVAFSEGITLSATINLPLTAFFQNQLFFSTATGPGELVFQVKGGMPEIMPNDAIKPSDPRDVIVFDLDGIYSLVADLNPISAYFLGHRVVPDGSTALIRQAPEARSAFSNQTTAVRRALMLLLPLTMITLLIPLLISL
jgi:hypothetical protein